MTSYINLGIDLFLNSILLVPIVLLWQRNRAAKHKWLMLLFACCLAGIFSVTGIPSMHSLHFDPTINMVPFADLSASPVQYCLNVLMFVPLGFIATLLWKKFSNFKNLFLFGFGISFFIEIMQIFNFRATDIDDLIANTTGAVIGFLICKLIFRKPNYQTHESEAREIFVLCMIVILINFTIQPIFSNAVWSLIYEL